MNPKAKTNMHTLNRKKQSKYTLIINLIKWYKKKKKYKNAKVPKIAYY